MKKLIIASFLLLIPSIVFGQDGYSNGVGITLNISPYISPSGFLACPQGIAITSTDCLVILNNTAATAGVPVQQSGRLRFRSNVWNTTAVAANNTNDFWMESVPTSGLIPTGVLQFNSSLNGAVSTIPFSINSNGVMTANSSTTGAPAFAFTLSSVEKARIGVAASSNGIINSSVSGDLGIRSIQKILFSTNGGSTAQVVIDGSGNTTINGNLDSTTYTYAGNTLAGTTGSIGGGLLAAGACASGTVAVTGSTTSMTVTVSPNTYPGDGSEFFGYVSSNGTVTVKVCAIVALTPGASTYNVRVQP